MNNTLTNSLNTLKEQINNQQTPKHLTGLNILLEKSQQELQETSTKLSSTQEYTEQYILQRLHLTITKDINLYNNMISTY